MNFNDYIRLLSCLFLFVLSLFVVVIFPPHLDAFASESDLESIQQNFLASELNLSSAVVDQKISNSLEDDYCSNVRDISKYSIHILHPDELKDAKNLLSGADKKFINHWHYVVVPISLADTKNYKVWENFFDQARNLKIIPVVRIVSEFRDGNWIIPDRSQIIQLLDFVSQFSWCAPERYVIIFNEVNHKAEWGGVLAPDLYLDVLRFSSNWARTQQPALKVLPAAMDLAAGNTSRTMDGFLFLKKMFALDPDWLNYIDGWNSHSYPNPGFISSATYDARNGLTGFRYEEKFLQSLGYKIDLPIFISETGWRDTSATRRHLKAYYLYAFMHVWSDDNIELVAPFLLRGSPGPFWEFSFLNDKGEKTTHYEAYQNAIDRI